MSKKLFVSGLCIFIMCIFICMTSYASKDVSLVIDNQKITCDVPPVIQNNRTLVPVRVLFEHLDATVSWNGTLRQAVVRAKDSVMIFNIDSKIMSLNGKQHTLDAAPVIVNDRTMVPIRFISEKLGYSVSWNEKTRTVYITSPKDNDNEDKKDDKEENDKEYDGIISSVKVNETSAGYKVNVYIDCNIMPKVMSIDNPSRLIFDFYNVKQACIDGKIKSNSDYVVETRWAAHEDYSRIVVETTQKCTYKVNYTSANKCTITIFEPSDTEDTEDAATKPVIKPPLVIVPNGTPLVVIDAGHGGHDPGAIGRDEEGNDILYEKDVCLDISKKIKTILENNGVQVLMTRSDDTALGDTEQSDLNTRVEIANDSEACLFVSIHNNAFTNDKANGTCVLYAGLGANDDYGITGKELAQNIQDLMLKATGLYDRGIVESPGIAVLRKTKMPAALVECAFITNPDDRKLLESKSKRLDMSEAIAQGIINSLKQMGRLK